MAVLRLAVLPKSKAVSGQVLIEPLLKSRRGRHHRYTPIDRQRQHVTLEKFKPHPLGKDPSHDANKKGQGDEVANQANQGGASEPEGR